MKIIDFDLQLAKKIVSREIEGKVLYCSSLLSDSLNARIVCFDFKLRKDEIRGIVLVSYKDGAEFSTDFNLNSGDIGVKGCTKLMLEVPDIYSYKKGDILVYKGAPFIFDRYDSEKDEVYSLAGITIGGLFKEKSNDWCFTERIEGIANQDQIDRLMKAIKENGYEWDAKKLELKEVREFKPFDRVIGEYSVGSIPLYRADLFSHRDKEGLYDCIGGIYSTIYPFEGNEHLILNKK